MNRKVLEVQDQGLRSVLFDLGQAVEKKTASKTFARRAGTRPSVVPYLRTDTEIAAAAENARRITGERDLPEPEVPLELVPRQGPSEDELLEQRLRQSAEKATDTPHMRQIKLL